MCDVRTATVITFIFRINTLSFPLCRHFGREGEAHFIFFSPPKSSCQNFAFPSPLTASTPSLEITQFAQKIKKERKEKVSELRLVPLRRRFDEEDEESRFGAVPVCHRLARLRVCGHLKAFFPCLPVCSSSARTADG